MNASGDKKDKRTGTHWDTLEHTLEHTGHWSRQYEGHVSAQARFVWLNLLKNNVNVNKGQQKGQQYKANW